LAVALLVEAARAVMGKVVVVEGPRAG